MQIDIRTKKQKSRDKQGEDIVERYKTLTQMFPLAKKCRKIETIAENLNLSFNTVYNVIQRHITEL